MVALVVAARNYLHLPKGIGVAIGRLNEGRKIDGARLAGKLTLPDGTTVEHQSFDYAADFLRRYSARTEDATQPEFNILATADRP